MPTRVFALLLAVVLLWSGLSTIEAARGLAPSSPQQSHAVAAAGEPDAAPAGSVEHHPLDGLPAQAQSDSPTETPGLLPAPLMPSTHAAAMGRPSAFVSAETGSPVLAGPLRPPCCAALAG
ncbi:hypothetical protein [Ideonella sp. A 288]|uniref:hypothetical protein n=1 Tax=Ideonella sp. A 288 TaxID=1962181 RepID=UPI001186D16F|nr:hypothetical protein [Ideonella sp. A 288]